MTHPALKTALCDLTGVEKPEHLQGASFLSVLENPASPHRDFAYSSYPHGRGEGKTGVVGHSMRTDRYRYTEWWEKGTDRSVASILTDIEADPGETSAVDGENELVERLSSALRKKVLAVRK